MSVPAQVVIERRFRGPADSGNGGYSCGALAGFLPEGVAEVTLRLPPPLGRQLAVETADGAAALRDGEALVAEARLVEGFRLDLPNPVDLEEAAAAREASPLHSHHPFPGCFVCGPERQAGDGLRIVCGPVGSEAVAAPWEVDDSVMDEGGAIPPEIVWAALDCPGGLAGMLVPGVGTCVLGRLSARFRRAVLPGTTCVAMGWPIEVDGRKLHAGSAIFSEHGEPLAEARATWIELEA
jgi:hypothetical protein